MSDLQMIREERADIARQRSLLERRDADLAITEKVLAGYAGAKATAGPQAQKSVPYIGPVPTSRRERVLEALGGEKLWMTSAEINKAIAKRHGLLMKGTSLYPMLSLLKKDEVIVREGERMALASRIKGGSAVTS